MDAQVMLIEFALSLVITIFVYLFVPVIILISGKKLKPSTIKKITAANGFVCFLIFYIIQTEIGNDGASIGVCFTWSAVAYWMLTKKCSIYAPSKPKTRVESKSTKFCVHCGAAIDYDAVVCVVCGCSVGKIKQPVFRKIKWKVVCNIVVSLSLIASVLVNFALYVTAEEFSATATNLEAMIAEKTENENAQAKKIEELQHIIVKQSQETQNYSDFWADNYEKVEFIDEYVVFIEDDGTDLYHKYECYRFTGNYFWAYNVEAAIGSGYEPCDHCFGSAFDYTQNFLAIMEQTPSLGLPQGKLP